MTAGSPITRGDILAHGRVRLIVWDHDADMLGCYPEGRGGRRAFSRVSLPRAGQVRVGKATNDQLADVRRRVGWLCAVASANAGAASDFCSRSAEGIRQHFGGFRRTVNGWVLPARVAS